MEPKKVTKTYTKDALQIYWKPHLCIHAGVCVQKLPEVYNPKLRPWIKPENANKDDLIEQINACPSGALSYSIDNQENMEDSNNTTKVEVFANGPMIVHGTMNITHSDGTVETKEKRAAFCRCGASQRKPYCDGEHKKIGFEG